MIKPALFLVTIPALRGISFILKAIKTEKCEIITGGI
jgi:hypothetical protein